MPSHGADQHGERVAREPTLHRQAELLPQRTAVRPLPSHLVPEPSEHAGRRWAARTAASTRSRSRSARRAARDRRPAPSARSSSMPGARTGASAHRSPGRRRLVSLTVGLVDPRSQATWRATSSFSSFGELAGEGRDAGRRRTHADAADRRRYSVLTRPGELENSTVRSDRRTASRTLCVTKTIVRPELGVDPLDLVVHGVTRHRVERGERLVHQHDVGLLGEHASQRGALPHATRQLVRTTVLTTTEMDEGEEFLDLGGPLALRDAAQLERQVDVLAGREPGEQRGFLEHERDLASTEVDGALGGLVESGDQVEERALAAAAGSDDAEKLPLCNVEVDCLKGRGRVCDLGRTSCPRR